MKKIKLVLGFLVGFLLTGNLYAQTVSSDLVGLGMKPELADYIAGILPAGSVVGNTTWIKGRNAANSADINMFRINSSDDTVINSSASDDLVLQLEDDVQRLVSFDASSDTALRMFFGDGGTTAAQVLSIVSSTADADDDSAINFGGGGAADVTRGSYVTSYGNEHATNPGNVDAVLGGSAANFRVIGAAGATALLDLEDNGDTITTVADLILNTQDKGIQVLSAATLDADVTTLSTVATSPAYFGSNSSGNKINIISNIADAVGGSIRGLKTRAAVNSWDANTIAVNGDDILDITGYASDGAAYINAAQILLEVGGVPGLTTDMPGNIKFLTVPDGSGTLTLAMTIEPDQDLLLTGDIYLADGQNLAWTGQSGANTACDTTCTGGCVAGWDTGTSVFVACTNAIADTCLCTK